MQTFSNTIAQEFYRAIHTPTGREVFAWLTNEQLFGPDTTGLVEVWQEVRGGEMIPHEVILGDLQILDKV